MVSSCLLPPPSARQWLLAEQKPGCPPAALPPTPALPLQSPAGVGGRIGVWFSSFVASGHGISQHRLIFLLLLLLLQLFELNRMSRRAAVTMPCAPGMAEVRDPPRYKAQSGRRVLFWRWRTAASRADRNNSSSICICCGLVAFDGHLSSGAGDVARLWMGKKTRKHGLRARRAPRLKCESS